jgi:hypothetical protein
MKPDLRLMATSYEPETRCIDILMLAHFGQLRANLSQFLLNPALSSTHRVERSPYRPRKRTGIRCVEELSQEKRNEDTCSR